MKKGKKSIRLNNNALHSYHNLTPSRQNMQTFIYLFCNSSI